ncbi:hypothetical protein E4U44_004676 [Claviceps purpurea]|nr:hypothetical protein E4U44_004676 [Claviceps purpurea]
MTPFNVRCYSSTAKAMCERVGSVQVPARSGFNLTSTEAAWRPAGRAWSTKRTAPGGVWQQGSEAGGNGARLLSDVYDANPVRWNSMADRKKKENRMQMQWTWGFFAPLQESIFLSMCHDFELQLSEGRSLAPRGIRGPCQWYSSPWSCSVEVVGNHDKSQHFLNNIRRYNAALSLTSCSVDGEPRIDLNGGINVVQLHSELYHWQGPLRGKAQAFAQLLFYSTEEATVHRLERPSHSKLDPELRELHDELIK